MKLLSIAPNAHYDMTHGQPKVLEKDNDGSCVVRLNVAPEMGGNGDIAVQSKKAIIRSIVDETAEFDLVNSYNKHLMGIKVDESAVQKYKDFLTLTEEIDAVLVESLKS